ncbi:8160_t:CDS:2, partial [Ambispora leptoticha]
MGRKKHKNKSNSSSNTNISKSNVNKEIAITQTQDDTQKLNSSFSVATMEEINVIPESKEKSDSENKSNLENICETASDITRNVTVIDKDLDGSQSDQISNKDTIDVPTSDYNDERNSIYVPTSDYNNEMDSISMPADDEISRLDFYRKKENLSNLSSTANQIDGFIKNNFIENDSTTPPPNISNNKIYNDIPVHVKFATNGMSVHRESSYEFDDSVLNQLEHDDFDEGLRSLPCFDAYLPFTEYISKKNEKKSFNTKTNMNNRVKADMPGKIDKKHKNAQKNKTDKRKQNVTYKSSTFITTTSTAQSTKTSKFPIELEAISPNLLATRPFLLYNVAYYFDNLVERISVNMERYIDRSIGLPI